MMCLLDMYVTTGNHTVKPGKWNQNIQIQVILKLDVNSGSAICVLFPNFVFLKQYCYKKSL